MKILLNNKKINIIYANKFKIRLLGLMNKKTITYGVLFPHCNSIHTFFMKDLIDVIMLDKNYKIKYLYKSLSKNKIIFHKNIYYILELPKNSISKLKINDYIKIEN